jgi:hypothetical protein
MRPSSFREADSAAKWIANSNLEADFWPGMCCHLHKEQCNFSNK